MRMRSQLPVVLCISASLLSVASAASCTAPFELQLGRCLFIERSNPLNWCQANRACWLLGGELLTDLSILQPGGLESLVSIGAEDFAWLGVTDLAEERYDSKSGWHLANDRGLFYDTMAAWRVSYEPNGGLSENCVGYNFVSNLTNDMTCLVALGYICQEREKLTLTGSSAWRSVGFGGLSRPDPQQYCASGNGTVQGSLIGCIADAMRQIYPIRTVLYNRVTRLCRYLEFTDALMESQIETSGDPAWVKYRPVP